MLMRKHYDILVVDDDSDVLAVTELALKHMRYAGIPLKIHACSSGEAAKSYLEGSHYLPSVAVAIIDVVMETDTAGLDLCNYIRSSRSNKVTQIIIRTGQAASHPEHDVTTRYDISGYLSKSDASTMRLNSIVHTAIRQYDWASNALMFYQLYGAIILGFRNPSELCKVIEKFVGNLCPAPHTTEFAAVEPHLAFALGERTVNLGVFSDPFHRESALGRLNATNVKSVNFDGDIVKEAPNDVGSVDILISLEDAGRTGTEVPPVSLLARAHAMPPDYAILMWQKLLHSIRRLYLVSQFVEEMVLENKLDRVWPE